MKQIIFLIGIFFLSFHSYSQEKISNSKLDNTKREWTQLHTEENFLVEYKFIDCDPEMGFSKEMVLLQFTNLTNEKIQLKWFVQLTYNDVCKTCDYPEEYTYVLDLKPNESLSGDCAIGSDHKLTIFSKFIDKNYKGNVQLTQFELDKLSFLLIK